MLLQSLYAMYKNRCWFIYFIVAEYSLDCTVTNSVQCMFSLFLLFLLFTNTLILIRCTVQYNFHLFDQLLIFHYSLIVFVVRRRLGNVL